MGFNYLRDNSGNFAPVLKTIPADSETSYKSGDALVVTGGKATKATGTTKPEYICATTGEGLEEVAAIQVTPTQEYRTEFSADASAVAIGAKVTIGTSADNVTATTTNGVAEIITKYGTGEAGTDVVVRFS